LEKSLTDIFEFARLGREAHGEEPIIQFERLIDGVADEVGAQRGMVRWRVSGRPDAQGRLFLHVQAHAAPTLVCQRCLQPVVVNVEADNLLQVVRSQEHPDDADDPDAPESIVGSARFDLLGLVEDELILAMPYVPLHEICAAPTGSGSPPPKPEAEAVRPSPFAALGQLKKN
jgi:uncharacterized protein